MPKLSRSTVTLLAALALVPLAGCDDHPLPSAPRVREEAASAPLVRTSEQTQAQPLRLPFEAAAYDGWLDGIPAGLDLGAGQPSRRAASWTVCGKDALRPHEVVERRTVRQDLGALGTQMRDLRLFVDDRAAHAYEHGVLRAARGCHELSSVTSPGPGQLHISSDASRRLTWSEVVRVGNAVLTTLDRGPYADAMGKPDPTVRHHRLAQDVVDRMCVFTPDGCAVAEPDIPVDFPLAAGLPTPDQAEGPGAGLAGPSRALPPPAWELCGSTYALPEVRDRMAAQWSNPEDYRGRQLVTFADEQSATAFVAGLAAFFRSCPEQTTGVGFVSHQHVEARAPGDQAYALYQVQDYQGTPSLGIGVTQVVRVGRAVLLDSVSNEGGAPGVPTQLRRMTDTSATIVARMCAWSGAGCS